MNYPLFINTSHTNSYRLYRPSYPPELYEHIVQYYFQNSSQHDMTRKILLAADIACGSGQATADLSNYCERVIGIDGSQNQLENAVKKPNIEYKCGNAEDLSAFFSPNSLDLITVATGLHWFNTEHFFKEVDRVLKLNGVVAIWAYGIPTLDNNDEATKVFDRFCTNDLRDCWSDRIEIGFQYYKSILNLFPYEQTRIQKALECKKEMTIQDFIKFIATYSSFQTYRERFGEEKSCTVLEKLARDLANCYDKSNNDNEQEIYRTKIIVNWQFPLYLMRKI